MTSDDRPREPFLAGGYTDRVRTVPRIPLRTVPRACVKVQPGLALAPPTTHTWCILYTKHLKKRPTSLLNLRQRLTPSIVASTAVLQAVGLATATLILISWLYMAKKKNKAAAAQAAAQHADEDSPVDYEAEEQEQGERQSMDVIFHSLYLHHGRPTPVLEMGG